MERDKTHELTAAYALNALDPQEEAAFEEHLAGCEACRTEIAALIETAGALASSMQGPPPPPELRARILDRVAGERTNVVPLRGRRPFQAALVAAAAALALAVGFGAWATSLSSDLDKERRAAAESARAAEVLAEPETEHHQVEGTDGVLAIAPDRGATLVLSGLPPAPDGHTYEAWVVVEDNVQPAGLFQAGSTRTVARLSVPVPEGALVGVTVEPTGGSRTPSGEMLVTARAA